MAERAEVTVVGAGLVGSLMAICLARRGYRVRALERRPDMRRETMDAGRSINLAISERGLHALRQVGLEQQALAHAIPMRGRMIHAPDGGLALQPYGKDDSQCIRSISRAWLNAMLMTEAEKTGQVGIDFLQRVTAVSFETGELSLSNDRTQASTKFASKVILGTDGAFSAVRQEMNRRSGFEASQDILSHGYKELVIPAGPEGSYRLEKNALHIWPRGNFMLIALPNEDGSFTATLFLPFEGPVSFRALEPPGAERVFFEREFPDALALLPNLEAEFQVHPTGSMVTVKSFPWHVGGRALLLGDAAHGIVPFYGQGMNCGFEDCVVLDRLIAQVGWERAFGQFGRDRKPDADAIADMAVENFVEMRDKTADPRFLLEKQIEKRLLNAFPGEFLSRYTLVSFSLAPYRFALGVGEIAGKIVRELAEGITDAQQVELDRAGRLIREKLTPYIREHRYGSAA